MISPEHKKPAGLSESVKEPENVSVNFFYVGELPVFPELVAVTQFNIGKSVLIVIAQCCFIYGFVVEKTVIPCTASPVAVAEQNKLRKILGAYYRSRAEGFVNLPAIKTVSQFHKKHLPCQLMPRGGNGCFSDVSLFCYFIGYIGVWGVNTLFSHGFVRANLVVIAGAFGYFCDVFKSFAAG